MKKKILSFMLSFTLLFTSSSLVFADTVTETQTVENPTEDTVLSTTVSVTVPSEFSVIVPKKMTLNAATGIGTYTVTVNGDITSTEYISVKPDESFLLSSSGKEDVEVAVTQDFTEWYMADMNTSKEGTVTAEEKLTSGTWAGSFNFNIKWNLVPGLYDTSYNMIAAWDDIGLDIEGDYQSSTKADFVNGCCGNLNALAINAVNPSRQACILVVDDSVTKVGDGAFYSCNTLKEIIFPDTIKEVGTYAFAACTASFELPSGVKIIDSYAFNNRQAALPMIPNSVTDIGLSIGNYGASAPNYAYYSSLANADGSVIVGDGILLSVKTNETTYTVPNNVKKIASYAFGGSPNITEVIVPAGVEVEGLAFNGTAYATTLQNSSADNLVVMNNSLIDATKATGEVIVPQEVTRVGERAFYNTGDKITKITLTDNVTTIGREAFYWCSATDVTLGNSITTIEEDAFGCAAFTSITLPESLRTIKRNAFYRSALTSIDIPTGVEIIENGAFYYNSNLASATISDTVTEIGAFAFCMTKLTEITIPTSVKEIGNGAFESTTTLASVTYDGVTYTSIAALTTALENNGVKVGNHAFYRTALSE